MPNPSPEIDFPPIPQKKYFTISEAAILCGTNKTHKLRAWEKEFDSLKPARRENRRYYQYQDLLIMRRISSLLSQGFTIQGVKRKMDQEDSDTDGTARKQLLRQSIGDLEEVLRIL